MRKRIEVKKTTLTHCTFESVRVPEIQWKFTESSLCSTTEKKSKKKNAALIEIWWIFTESGTFIGSNVECTKILSIIFQNLAESASFFPQHILYS